MRPVLFLGPLVFGCGPSDSGPDRSRALRAELGWAVDLSPFAGAPVYDEAEVFSLASADMDRDGDLDLVINRHLDVPMELFDNVDGTYVHLNPKGDDPSGIYDNPLVHDLYSHPDPMLAAADAAGPGVYLWHDLVRSARWQVYTIPQPGELVPSMRVTVNRPLVEIGGGVLVTELDEFSAEVVPRDPLTPTRFEIDSELIGTQLILEVVSDTPDTIYVGTTQAPFEGGRVSLWKPDQHGLAWHDVVGDDGLELFVTRGGLIGQLLPPHEGKVDQLFVHTAGETLYEQDAAAIPPNYGRGRQVAWVDLDGDGADELYVANTETPNSVLDDPGTGSFDDRAVELGLDLHDADAFAWLDVDADGWLDLVYSDVTELMVAHSEAGAAFTVVDGEAYGLSSPASPEDAPEGIFNQFTFQIVDHDRDGDMDLWLSDWGNQHGVAVYRNDGGSFSEVTSELGLADAFDFSTLILADLDQDAWVDAIGVGSSTHVWRNLGGTFEAVEVETDDAVDLSATAISTDIDGDGFVDLVGSRGGTRWVARNTTEQLHQPLTVDVRAPLGSRVVAHCSDGSRSGQQWGAMNTSRFSQGVQPLTFGVPLGERVTQLVLVTPGGEVSAQSVAGGEVRVSLEAVGH